MNSVDSIRPSVDIIRKAKVPFALLHCTNIYPTPPELVRLGAINKLREAFPDAVLGLSDHTVNNYTCLGAVALGASILERHFIDNKNREGPDILCSMDPASLSELIEGSKTIFFARGDNKEAIKEESSTMDFAFASVVAIKDISPGEKLSKENIWVMRPGGGDFGVKDFEKLIGKKSLSFIQNGYQLAKNQVET